jgi:hypothetical protein
MITDESTVINWLLFVIGREHKVSLEAKENVVILVCLYVCVIYVVRKH